MKVCEKNTIKKKKKSFYVIISRCRAAHCRLTLSDLLRTARDIDRRFPFYNPDRSYFTDWRTGRGRTAHCRSHTVSFLAFGNVPSVVSGDDHHHGILDESGAYTSTDFRVRELGNLSFLPKKRPNTSLVSTLYVPGT